MCLVRSKTIVYVERLPISSQCATLMDAIFIIEQVSAHTMVQKLTVDVWTKLFAQCIIILKDLIRTKKEQKQVLIKRFLKRVNVANVGMAQ